MLKTKDEVRWQQQDEEIYLVYFNQDIFETNDVGIRVLELCHDPQTPAGLKSLLLAEYEIDEGILDADLTQIIPDFKRMGILEEVDDEQ